MQCLNMEALEFIDSCISLSLACHLTFPLFLLTWQINRVGQTSQDFLPAVKTDLSGKEEGFFFQNTSECLLYNTHFELEIYMYYDHTSPAPLSRHFLYNCL